MEIDEILRLCQISGLTEMFKDAQFSQAWDLGGEESAEVDLDDAISEVPTLDAIGEADDDDDSD
jgi:hypothetical protein